MVPRPLSNPPNPWLSTEVEYLEEIPPAELEVYQDHTREILSHNDSPDVGFSWSVNPYRGCFHACAYCLSGDTQILMADGNKRALAEVRAGDGIYGTMDSGQDRRCARTCVLEHWRTVKQAFRITLGNGATLIASADHRFLTERGWKYVMGQISGHEQRSHLTTGTSLLGIPEERDVHGPVLQSSTKLRVASIEPLGVELPMYDITTGTGDFVANGVVSHNCYARKTHTYLDLDSGEDFNSKIVVKVNAPDVLRKELAAKRWRGEHIAMGTNVDCY